MIYDFDSCPDRRPTECEKWNVYDQDVLPLWVADMDFVSPQPVIAALQERVAHGVFGYPTDPPGLRQVIVDRLAERYAWQVQPQDLVFVPGVIVGFNQACRVTAQPGSSVVVQTPVYPPFLSAPENSGLSRIDASLTLGPDGSYGIDFEAFEAALAPHTRLFILCNPHNPVGRVFRRDELERLAEICLRHGVTICSDEIHSDLLFPPHRHIPIAHLSPEVAQNTITLLAPSKTFNLAGLQCSIAVIQNPELRQRYQACGKGLVSRVNLLGLVAAEAAYRYGQEWLDQLLVYLQGNRKYLLDFVEHNLPGVRFAAPEGTYLAWLDCRPLGIPGNLGEYFLEKARVALENGNRFGPGGEGFIRLNFGCPRAQLAEALERMRSALPA